MGKAYVSLQHWDIVLTNSAQDYTTEDGKSQPKKKEESDYITYSRGRRGTERTGATIHRKIRKGTWAGRPHLF
jgi:hypothetical protein